MKGLPLDSTTTSLQRGYGLFYVGTNELLAFYKYQTADAKRNFAAIRFTDANITVSTWFMYYKVPYFDTYERTYSMLVDTT
jgi:hypothetical protein